MCGVLEEPEAKERDGVLAWLVLSVVARPASFFVGLVEYHPVALPYRPAVAA